MSPAERNGWAAKKVQSVWRGAFIRICLHRDRLRKMHLAEGIEHTHKPGPLSGVIEEGDDGEEEEEEEEEEEDKKEEEEEAEDGKQAAKPAAAAGASGPYYSLPLTLPPLQPAASADRPQQQQQQQQQQHEELTLRIEKVEACLAVQSSQLSVMDGRLVQLLDLLQQQVE